MYASGARVAADDHPHSRPERPHETNHAVRGPTLEGHDRESDNVRPQFPDQPSDRFLHPGLHEHEVGDRHTMVRVHVAGQ
jgi:hypothetical protein